MTPLEKTVDEYNMLPERGAVLCAVSGGADSVCLLLLMRELAELRGFPVVCAHFNHQLRGAESDRDERFTRELCERLNVPFAAGRGDVNGYAAENGMGTEEAARVLRYEFLSAAAVELDASVIATAHTADDNAETVLLNLARGAGTKGLAGIPPVRGNIIRPMLSLTREDVLTQLRRFGETYVEDSTNAADDYARNRVRHRIMPLLRELNPDFSGAASRACRLLRQDDEYLSSLAEDFISEYRRENSLPAKALLKLPQPVFSRVIRAMLSETPSSDHIDAVYALCRKSDGELHVPGQRLRLMSGRLYFGGVEPLTFESFSIAPGLSATIPEAGLRLVCREVEDNEQIHSSLNTFFFKYENICGTIAVRPRKNGDKLAIAGRNCTKSLKKLFLEAGLPRSLRELTPVICDEAGILAVYGFGVSERAVAKQGDRAICLEIDKNVGEYL